MNFTARYSVCVPVLDDYTELSEHLHEGPALIALGIQQVTDPDAVLWDWERNIIIAGGEASA